MSIKDDSEKDLHQHIEQLLNHFGNEYSILDISELDGFVYALDSAPQEIPISEWMPAIWGGGDNTPDWQSEQEINDFVNAFTAFYGLTMHRIQNNQYSPMFSEKVLDQAEDSIADEWCFGFLRGIKLWPELNAEDKQLLEELLQAIQIFATDEGKSTLENTDKDKMQDLIHQVKINAEKINQHFKK